MAEKVAVQIETLYLQQFNQMFNLNNTIRFNDYGRGFKTASPESTIDLDRPHKNNTRGF